MVTRISKKCVLWMTKKAFEQQRLQAKTRTELAYIKTLQKKSRTVLVLKTNIALLEFVRVTALLVLGMFLSWKLVVDCINLGEAYVSFLDSGLAFLIDMGCMFFLCLFDGYMKKHIRKHAQKLLLYLETTK